MHRDKVLLDVTLGPHSDRIYAALRIIVGLLISFHGMQKLFGILAEQQPPPMSQVWFGGIIELVGGIAVALGLFTRWAAILLSGTMAVAYFQFHWKLQWDANFFPGINQGELAAVYSFVFLYIASKGPGPWSLDLRAGIDRKSSLPD